MALAVSTNFACTYEKCSNQLYLLCLYNKVYAIFLSKVGKQWHCSNFHGSSVPAAGQNLYTNDPALCGSCANDCANGLCHPAFTPGEKNLFY